MRKNEWGESVPETAADHLELAQDLLPHIADNGCRSYELDSLRDAIEHVVQAVQMMAPAAGRAYPHPHYNLCGDD